MIRKFLSLLLLCLPGLVSAQKLDFLRTPNGPNIIVDYNLKARTFVAPHGSTLTLGGAQDSTGHIRVMYDGTNYGLYYYIKPVSGSGFWVNPGAASVTTIAIPTGTALNGSGFAVVSYAGTQSPQLQRIESGYNDNFYPEIRKYPTEIWVYLGDVDDGTGHTNHDYQLVLR